MKTLTVILLALLIIAYIPIYAEVFCLLFLKKAYVYRGLDDEGVLQYFYMIGGEEFVCKPRNKYTAKDGILVYRSSPESGWLLHSFKNYKGMYLPICIVFIICITMLFCDGKLICFVPVLVIEAIFRQIAIVVREYSTMVTFSVRYVTDVDSYDSLAIVYRKPWYTTWWFKPLRCVLLTWFVMSVIYLYYDPNIVETTEQFMSVKGAVFPYLCPKYLKELCILSDALKNGANMFASDIQVFLLQTFKGMLCMIYALAYPTYILSRNHVLYCIYKERFTKLSVRDKDVKGRNT